jgi:hypothetical protein
VVWTDDEQIVAAEVIKSNSIRSPGLKISCPHHSSTQLVQLRALSGGGLVQGFGGDEVIPENVLSGHSARRMKSRLGMSASFHKAP